MLCPRQHNYELIVLHFNIIVSRDTPPRGPTKDSPLGKDSQKGKKKKERKEEVSLPD